MSISRMKIGVAGLAVAAAMAVTAVAQTTGGYTITTFAGTGARGFDGDGASAAAAKIDSPWGIAVDSSGAVYISDTVNNRIRKVTGATITTFAGKGTSGFSGNAGAATAAELNKPTALAIASNGDVYVADTLNSMIRKITSAGTITTVAGSELSGFSGDGEAATSALLRLPLGVAVDSAGVIYIADTYNHRIRKVAADGKISTIAGTGTAGSAGDGGEALKARLNYPEGISLDSAGNLYVADSYNHRIRKITPAGIISTVAGRGIPGFGGDNGPATAARLYYPKSVQAAADGRLYITDTYNSRIRVVEADGTIRTIAGTGRFGDFGENEDARRAELRFPNAALRAANGNVYIADAQNNKVRMLTPVNPGPTEEREPVISFSGVTTPAEFGHSGRISAGSWLEIRGLRLAAAERGWTEADFRDGIAPMRLEDTRVLLGGRETFVSFVSPELVRVLVPGDVQPGEAELVVETAEGRTAPYKLMVEDARAMLNTPERFSVNGERYAAAVFEDGKTYALPEAVVEGVASRPAKAGERLTFYGIGFGQVTPDVRIGDLVSKQNTLVKRLEVWFGESRAEVVHAGMAEGSVGIYQISVVVPEGAAGEAVAVRIALDGERMESSPPVAIAR